MRAGLFFFLLLPISSSIPLRTTEEPSLANVPRKFARRSGEFFGFIQEVLNENGTIESKFDEQRLLKNYVMMAKNYLNSDIDREKRVIAAYEKRLKLRQKNYIKEVNPFILEETNLQSTIEKLQKDSANLKLYMIKPTTDGKNDVCAILQKTTADQIRQKTLEILTKFNQKYKYNSRLFNAMKKNLEWNFYQAYVIHFFCFGLAPPSENSLNEEIEEFRNKKYAMNTEIGQATSEYNKPWTRLFHFANVLEEQIVAPVLDANENATNDQLADLVLQKLRQKYDRHYLIIVTNLHQGEYRTSVSGMYVNSVIYKRKIVYVFLASESFDDVAKTRKTNFSVLESNVPQSLEDVKIMLEKSGLAYIVFSPVLPEFPFSVIKSHEDVAMVKRVQLHEGEQAFVAIVF